MLGTTRTADEAIANIAPEAIAAAVGAEATNGHEYKKSGILDGIAVRREAQLVARFQAALEADGHSVGRYRLRPAGEPRDLYTDIFDHTENRLYEAKASATRDAIRMALGQLLDYSRHIPGNPDLAVLLPAMPTDDLQILLHRHRVKCVYEASNGTFITAKPPVPG
ncbi:hypothetical protein GCM10009609_60390 [Pseudonocardia aurantiaca]